MFIVYSFILYLCICNNILTGADHRFNLLTSNKQPTQALSELLHIFDIKHNGSLNDIVRITQSHWLRVSGIERDHINTHQTIEQKKAYATYAMKSELANHLLESIGVVHPIKPLNEEYDYLHFNSGILVDMQLRMQTLIAALQKCSIGRIVLLTGDTPLDPENESVNHIRQAPCFDTDPRWQMPDQLPKTNCQLTIMLLQQAHIDQHWNKGDIAMICQKQPVIERYKDQNIECVNAPMKGSQRANTADTYRWWKNSNPQPGTCLAISNQPFIGYQEMIARNELPDGFTVEEVGTGTTVTQDNILMHLDNIARCLYTALHKK